MGGNWIRFACVADHSSIDLLRFVQSAFTDQIQALRTLPPWRTVRIGGVVVVSGLQLIHEELVLFESLARRIDFQGAGELTRGEVFESKMVVHVSQLTVTDVRVQLVGQERLANRGFSLVAFEFDCTEAESAPGGFPRAAGRAPARG